MNTNATSHTLRGVVCTALGGVCWGFSGTCGQYLFSRWPGVSTMWLTCVRLLAGGVILMVIAAIHCPDQLRQIWRDRRDAAEVVLFGLLGLVPCQYAYMAAISYTNAATTTVLQNVSLVIIMLLSCCAARRLPRPIELLSLILAGFGVWIIATGGDPRHMVLSPQGLFWGMVTAGGITVYTMLPKRLLSRWSREAVNGWAMLIGGVALNLGVRSWNFTVDLPLRGWLAVTAIVVLGTVVSTTLFSQGIHDIGPVRTSMLATTEPMSAAVFSAVWLGTRFSAADLVGFACIIATILLLARSDE